MEWENPFEELVKALHDNPSEKRPVWGRKACETRYEALLEAEREACDAEKPDEWYQYLAVMGLWKVLCKSRRL